MSFGERLRNERRAKGLSQAELAGDRCSVSYVSHLEKGRRAPTREVARYFEERLSLSPRTLLAEIDGALSRREEGAEMLGTYEHARELARMGELGLALELAESVDRNVDLGSDLGYLSRVLIGEIQIDLGRYAESVVTLTSLSEQCAGRDHLMLNIDLHLSRAQRLAEQLEQAHMTGLEAVQIARVLHGESSTRLAEALIAAVSSASDEKERRKLECELVEVAAEMPDGHSKGRAQWALGTAALLHGEPDAGRRWYASAEENLSPAASFRDWARFPRGAAGALLKAGETEGVEHLLELARMRLDVFPAPDEVATLDLYTARYRVATGATTEAETVLREALHDVEISAITHADLLLELAKVTTAEDKRELALQATKLFTTANSLRGAKDAWAFISSLE